MSKKELNILIRENKKKVEKAQKEIEYHKQEFNKKIKKIFLAL